MSSMWEMARSLWPFGEEDASVFKFGAKMAGQEKYLGGEVGPDGCIYSIPGHATRVLRIDPAAKTCEFVGPEFPGQFKWLRSATGPDGAIYGIPCHAEQVLRIAVGADGAVSVTLIGPKFPGLWKWHGGVLGTDGAIYAIPQKAARVLKISNFGGDSDPTVELIGPSLGDGKCKWYGGLLSGNSIYGVPSCSPHVLKIECGSSRVSTFGDLPGGFDREGGWKWHGGVVAQDGSIWGVPANAHSFLKITPGGDDAADRIEKVGGPLRGGSHRDDDKYKYLGAVVGRDGCIYCIPSDADHVLKVDPATHSVEEFGASLASLAEGQSRGQNKWQNGFLGCDGKIYAIPLKAESVLRVDPITRAVDTIGGPLLGLHQWEGGVLGRDGALYCMPLRSDQVLVIAPPKTSEFFCGLAMTSQIGSE